MHFFFANPQREGGGVTSTHPKKTNQSVFLFEKQSVTPPPGRQLCLDSKGEFTTNFGYGSQMVFANGDTLRKPITPLGGGVSQWINDCMTLEADH